MYKKYAIETKWCVNTTRRMNPAISASAHSQRYSFLFTILFVSAFNRVFMTFRLYANDSCKP